MDNNLPTLKELIQINEVEYRAESGYIIINL